MKHFVTSIVILLGAFSPTFAAQIFPAGVEVDSATVVASAPENPPKMKARKSAYRQIVNADRPRNYGRLFEKGAVNLRLSTPYINGFNFSYGNERKPQAGFFGISLGFDVFLKDRMFLNLSGSGIMDFLLPFPAPIYYIGVSNHMNSVYGTLSNNHLLFRNRLSLGYGITFGRNNWNTHDHSRPPNPPYEDPEEATEEDPAEVIEPASIYRHSNAFGFVFPVYYYVTRSFYVGVVYRPMFLQFAGGTTRFVYQHTLSLDLGWRIRLTK